jgi:large subunit ribosomal protein L29
MSEAAELRRLSLPELDEKARTLRHSLFVMHVQHSQRSLAKTSQLTNARRELARVLTLIGEKRQGEAGK